MTDPDWYAILGVGRKATRAQIVRAFRRLAFRWHPDRNAAKPELAHQQFLLVHQAYEVLSDPWKRSSYDLDHPVRAETAPVASKAPSATRQSPFPQRPAPKAPPPAPARPSARTWLSRAAWLPLGLLLRIFSFAALFLLGPFAERRARHELDRQAPALLVDYLFPVGRIALVAGLVLLVLQKSWRPVSEPWVPIILIAAGVVIFVIERIALASVWAFGRGRRPKA